MKGIYINNYEFNKETRDILQKEKLYDDESLCPRPVVYILNNETEAYVGKTIDVSTRMSQHWENPDRRKLTSIKIITTDEFNKSVILDLESFLIGHMSADKKYKLQNGNGGLQSHNYYDKKRYQKQFAEIWEKLKELNIVKNNLKELENSNLFKYSPYKSLTDEQLQVVTDLKNQLVKDIKAGRKSSFIVNGGPGTGKTILGIYLMKLLSEIRQNEKELFEEIDNIDENIYSNVGDLLETNDVLHRLKIGLVIPMKNLRAILQDDVFKNIPGLESKNVLSPHNVAQSDNIWDILIVDESHRLRQRKNIMDYKNFDKDNKKLGLPFNGTEFDRIMKKSNYQIFLYDYGQTIKPTDIDKTKFLELTEKLTKIDDENKLNKDHHIFHLESQQRCLGGNRYIKYINSIFSNIPPYEKINFNNEGLYELKLFDNVDVMVNKIKELNNKIENGEKIGLCRNFAGYSREWNTKNIKPKPKNENETKEWIEKGYFDIKIGTYKYIWNSTDSGFISSRNSINEIGCIHTCQGFDLNFIGLIIGKELAYNNDKGFYVKKEEYYDKNGKNTINNDEELLKYILNIYRTMCTRGIRGTYIYACDEGLREYLAKFIDKV